jgi:hypothetical protein
VRAAEGLLAPPVSFNHFGQAEPKLCQYMTKVEGNQFVTINNGKPFCGTLIPNWESPDQRFHRAHRLPDFANTRSLSDPTR